MIPHPSEFVTAIAPAMRRATAIVRGFEGRVPNRPKQGEVTDVKAACTAADTASQEALLEALLQNFPWVSLRAEEETPTVCRFPKRSDLVVVIDPIDGTLRSYLEGNGPYAVMIGLARENAYTAALVALPREQILFQAIRGARPEWSVGEGPMRPVELESDGNRVLVSHELPEAARAVLLRHGFDVEPACGGAISVAPLLPGVRAGLRVANNEPRNVSVRGRIGAMISAEAGAVVCRENGDPFPRDIDEPSRVLLVAADSSDLPPLLEAVSAAGIA